MVAADCRSCKRPAEECLACLRESGRLRVHPIKPYEPGELTDHEKLVGQYGPCYARALGER